MGTLKNILISCLAAMLFSSCGGSENGTSNSITTSATTCTGGDAATSTTGEQFYRLYQNMNWEYSGVYSENNSAPTSYTNVASVGSNVLVGGILVATVSETNPIMLGPTSSYYLVNSSGIQDWTIIKEGTASIPLDMVGFPIMVGKQCQQSIGTVNYGDIDLDGRDDFGSIQVKVTILPFETVTVSAATFGNALKIESNVTQYITLSNLNKTLKEVATITEWRAANVGLVKQTFQTSVTGGNTPFTVSATETLKTRYSFIDNGIKDIVVDSAANTIYASSSTTDTVYQINAVTGETAGSLPLSTVGAPASPAGVNSGAYYLAMSDDLSKLYVELVNTNYVVPISLPSLTAGTPFQVQGGRIEVAPGDPATISMFVPYRLTVYSNGVLLPNSDTGAAYGTQRYSADGTKIFLMDSPYGYWAPISGNYGLNVYTVDTNGVAFAYNVPNVLQYASADLSIVNGVIYAADGSMVDSASMNAIGRLAVTGSIYYKVAVDSADNNVLFLTKPNSVPQVANVEIFNATTNTRIGQTRLPIHPTTTFFEPNQLEPLGNGKFAITNAQGQLYIFHETTLQ